MVEAELALRRLIMMKIRRPYQTLHERGLNYELGEIEIAHF